MKSFREPPGTNQDRTNPYEPTPHTLWQLLLELPIPKPSDLFLHSPQGFFSSLFSQLRKAVRVFEGYRTFLHPCTMR